MLSLPSSVGIIHKLDYNFLLQEWTTSEESVKVKETALYPYPILKRNSNPPVWKCLSLPLFSPSSQQLFKATAS